MEPKPLKELSAKRILKASGSNNASQLSNDSIKKIIDSLSLLPDSINAYLINLFRTKIKRKLCRQLMAVSSSEVVN